MAIIWKLIFYGELCEHEIDMSIDNFSASIHCLYRWKVYNK